MAREFSLLPEVACVGLFGSAAERAGLGESGPAIEGECRDVDLAVWLTLKTAVALVP